MSLMGNPPLTSVATIAVDAFRTVKRRRISYLLI
jgi:hypothetical protein